MNETVVRPGRDVIVSITAARSCAVDSNSQDVGLDDFGIVEPDLVVLDRDPHGDVPERHELLAVGQEVAVGDLRQGMEACDVGLARIAMSREEAITHSRASVSAVSFRFFSGLPAESNASVLGPRQVMLGFMSSSRHRLTLRNAVSRPERLSESFLIVVEHKVGASSTLSCSLVLEGPGWC